MCRSCPSHTSRTDSKQRLEQSPAAIHLQQLRDQGHDLLPIKVPGHYAQLVRSEIEALGETGGPLYNVVYPKADRFKQFAPGEVVNFVEDFDHMPADLERVIVHRYPGKLLYFPTDVCLGHCQYCFRPDVTGSDPSKKNRHHNLDQPIVDRVVNYLRNHPRVREVILSGGDPLSCKPALLGRAIEQIRSVPTIRHIRLHTKAPIFTPKVVTDALVNMLAEHDVRLVVHAVHPYELPPATAEAIGRFREAGLMVYNQFPLIRGVNDHPAVIMELAYRCAAIGAQMLTMFIADPIRYGATYRLRLQRVFDIADEVFLRGEGWISNFRVCLDSPVGKVRREHILCHKPDRDVYIFERDCQQVTYHDIPAELDQPTPLKRLLYRGADHVDLAEWTKRCCGPCAKR